MLTTKEVVILIVEDEDAHVKLIGRNVRRAGLLNPIIRFRDGQEVLDFLFRRSNPGRAADASYLMLLDIKMLRVDGVEVLRQVKKDPEMRNLPIIMITSTDDPREVERCTALGCSAYLTKPVDHGEFVEAIRKLGLTVRSPKPASAEATDAGVG
jgi:CheY-like chemotaxis protein